MTRPRRSHFSPDGASGGAGALTVDWRSSSLFNGSMSVSPLTLFFQRRQQQRWWRHQKTSPSLMKLPLTAVQRSIFLFNPAHYDTLNPHMESSTERRRMTINFIEFLDRRGNDNIIESNQSI